VCQENPTQVNAANKCLLIDGALSVLVEMAEMYNPYSANVENMVSS
jgi:hypothetical protein